MFRWVALSVSIVTALPMLHAAASVARATDAPTELLSAGAAAAEMPRLRSLLVSWRGELLLERYYHGARVDRLANIKSASKSIISTLVGVAVDRGLLSVDQPIGPFFPEIADDASKRAITIGDLLTMRSGLETTSNRNYGAWVQSRNWVRYALGQSLLETPGGQMRYSTGNSHLLSAILTRVTKQTTWQFAQAVLARPLGFSLVPWIRDPQGIYFGGNEMQMTPRQMLAFGELYRQRGQSNGKTIVSASWVAESWRVRTHSPRNGQGYGYGWWSRDIDGFDTHFAWGYGGQYIFVVPALDLTVVTTSSSTVAVDGDDRRENRDGIFTLLEDHIVPSIARLTTSTE